MRATHAPTPSPRALGALLAGLAAPASAAAQSPCPQAAEADALEAEGQRLNLAHDYAAALTRYEQAFALCRGASAQGRVAVTHIALGRWVEADRWMHDTLARNSDPWVDGNRARLLRQAEIIAAHIGELLVVGGGPAGEVRANGLPVATFPMATPVRVAAGEVTLRVEGRGRAPFERRVVVAAGQTMRVEVPAPNDRAAIPPPLPPESPRRTLRWVLAGSAAGLGAVGLGVGVWATFEAFHRRAEYDAACVAHQWVPTRERVAECGAGGRLLTRVWDDDVLIPQVAGFVAGGLLAATSIALFVTMPPSRTSTGVAWACGPLGAAPGVACAGTF